MEVCPGPILTAAGDVTFLGITFVNSEVGKTEQRHVREHFIQPLNSIVAASAQVQGWNLLGQVEESMYRNPICSPTRLVIRGVGESKGQQGDDRGTLHPNIAGHQVIAQLVAQHLPMPNAYRAASEYDDALLGPGQRYHSARPRHRLYSVKTEPGADTQREWLSVGLFPTTGRAFIDASPNLCNWSTMVIDAQAAEDYLFSNQRVVLEPFAISDAVIRLFRKDSPTSSTELARLHGYGSLTYTPVENDRGKDFFLLASTARNSETLPVHFARVHGGPTASDDYGTFEIRVRCPNQ